MRAVYLFPLLLFLMCCGKSKKVYFDDATIQKLTATEPGLPSFYDFYMFARTEGGLVCSVDINYLRYLYNQKGYNGDYATFGLFVSKVFNGEIALENRFFKKNSMCFEPDAALVAEFENHPFETVRDTYFDEKEAGQYWLKPRVQQALTEQKRNTVLYYSFLNNYRVYYEAVTARYYMRPF